MGSRNKKDIVLDTKAILAKHLKRKADYEASFLFAAGKGIDVYCILMF